MNHQVRKIHLILGSLKGVKEIGEEMSSDYLDEDTMKKYSSFVIPKKFVDYKWVLGTMFSTREEFKDVITNYVISNDRDLHFIKNDKTKFKV